MELKWQPLITPWMNNLICSSHRTKPPSLKTLTFCPCKDNCEPTYVAVNFCWCTQTYEFVIKCMILVTMISLSLTQLYWQPWCDVTAWPIIYRCPLLLDHNEETILGLLDCHCRVPCNVHYAATIPHLKIPLLSNKKCTIFDVITFLILINHLMPNDHYSGRTALLTSNVAFYIFIQQI